MIIKKIVLNNIRTYVNQIINFDETSTLLSGDIGCGKSSILLAIEFSLFGLARGKLAGESLLRKGSSEGFVETTLVIEGQEYTIKRSLKKQSNDTIKQTNGHIIINGETLQLTPVELKMKVAKLLGYPTSLVKSAKHFSIYRYTVYTPQEEIKELFLMKISGLIH